MFRGTYTSQGILRKDTPGQFILQAVCTDMNTFVLMSDGKLFTMGANDKWQCTELEDMNKESAKDCIDPAYF